MYFSWNALGSSIWYYDSSSTTTLQSIAVTLVHVGQGQVKGQGHKGQGQVNVPKVGQIFFFCKWDKVTSGILIQASL